MSVLNEIEFVIVSDTPIECDNYQQMAKSFELFDLRDTVFQCHRATHDTDPMWQGYVISVRRLTVNGRTCYAWN